jgi:hypothetical protein
MGLLVRTNYGSAIPLMPLVGPLQNSRFDYGIPFRSCSIKDLRAWIFLADLQDERSEFWN